MARKNKMRAVKFMKENAFFITCCAFAGIPPTKRQASKFRLEKGKAFQMRGEAIRQELLKDGVLKEEEQNEN